jgi:prepilin-type N-terminal cleavage/methylation domain-containing protein
MRIRPSRSSGFTLVELLVVIAIIAILASVLLGVGNQAINAAKRAKASTMINQIQTAVLNYYTEYSVYPVPTSTTPVDTYYNYQDNADWQPLIQVLAGDINTVPGANFGTAVPSASLNNLNTRLIPYLSVQIADLDTTYGILKNPFSTATAPQFFNIIIDADYSNLAGDSGNGKGKMPDFTNSTNTAFAYLGNNGVSGGCALWCNCDQPATGGGHPNFWVHTY